MKRIFHYQLVGVGGNCLKLLEFGSFTDNNEFVWNLAHDTLVVQFSIYDSFRF